MQKVDFGVRYKILLYMTVLAVNFKFDLWPNEKGFLKYERVFSSAEAHLQKSLSVSANTSGFGNYTLMFEAYFFRIFTNHIYEKIVKFDLEEV